MQMTHNGLHYVVTALVTYLIYKAFPRGSDFPTDVDTKKAMELYGNNKYVYLAFISLFVLFPTLVYVLGQVLMVVLPTTNVLPNGALFQLVSQDVPAVYIISGVAAFSFLFKITGWLYETVLGREGYKMYNVAQSILYDTDSFAMTRATNYLIYPCMLLAVFMLYSNNNYRLTAYPEKFNYSNPFFFQSATDYDYDDIKTIRYGYKDKDYKLIFRDKSYIVTDMFNQSPPESIPNTIQYISEKAKIRIDTVVIY